MVNYIGSFSNVKSTCSWFIMLFICCWIQFAKISFKLLNIYSWGHVGNCFPCIIFIWFSTRDNLTSKNGLEIILSFSVLWKSFVYNYYYFFLKCLVEFTSETIWAWSFLVAFKYKFNIFNRYVVWLFGVLTSCWVSSSTLYLPRNSSILSKLLKLLAQCCL